MRLFPNWEVRPGCEGKPPPPGLTRQPSGQLALRKLTYLNRSWLDNAGSWAQVKGADNFRKSTGESIQIPTLPSRFLKHGNTELLRDTKTYLHSSWCSGQFAPRCHYFHSYCHSTLKEKGEGTMLPLVTCIKWMRHSVLEPETSLNSLQKLSPSPTVPRTQAPSLRPPAAWGSARSDSLVPWDVKSVPAVHQSQVQTPTHFPRQPLHALISAHTTIISLSTFC